MLDEGGIQKYIEMKERNKKSKMGFLFRGKGNRNMT
jgi:hypothetical protein